MELSVIMASDESTKLKKQNPDPRSEAEQQALWEKDQAQLIYEDQHPEINELNKEKKPWFWKRWWKKFLDDLDNIISTP